MLQHSAWIATCQKQLQSLTNEKVVLENVLVRIQSILGDRLELPIKPQPMHQRGDVEEVIFPLED
jgi:hypothetical protein